MNASFESAFAKLRALDPTLPEQLQGSFAALEEAQISWRAFRQKDCDAYAGPFRAGEDGEMAFLGCMILQTRQRSDQLSAMIDDYGG
ncbi:uncharacterized protein DUF1311 [Roseibium hamelinense]|uniref:Uncharacterized protein DUF1311 n=2 Tax=Roseibium hamelinense TaxID=150831 RepID=A0A562SPC1_9HYPH|nr:uncharacterized protein DUF1311 [Roseibium hamelinense]